MAHLHKNRESVFPYFCSLQFKIGSESFFKVWNHIHTLLSATTLHIIKNATNSLLQTGYHTTQQLSLTNLMLYLIKIKYLLKIITIYSLYMVTNMYIGST